MDKEMDFFLMLLEYYAEHNDTTADVVLKEWDRAGMTDRIFSMYEIYHVESLDNAFDDIDRMIAEGSDS